MIVLLNTVLILIFTKEIIAHEHPAYSHKNKSNNIKNDWMKSIDNKTLISNMSLPGTHDTMAFYGGWIPQCQTLSLPTQLQAGIRVFDIRCRHVNNSFLIHHDIVYQRASFSDVLDDIVKFLKQNPSETLLLRVKEEYNPVGNNQSFEQTFVSYVTNTNYESFFWKPVSDNPTLGEVRGKLVVLQNFITEQTIYGLQYSSFNIQDDYVLNTNWDLYSKWEKVKNQLYNANNNRSDFYMNYLSGSTGSFPYFVVSGHSSPDTSAPRLLAGRTTLVSNSAYPDFPRVGCILKICSIAFEGTNILTRELIEKENLKFVGMVMTDFPGDGRSMTRSRANTRRIDNQIVSLFNTKDNFPAMKRYLQLDSMTSFMNNTTARFDYADGWYIRKAKIDPNNNTRDMLIDWKMRTIELDGQRNTEMGLYLPLQTGYKEWLIDWLKPEYQRSKTKKHEHLYRRYR